MAFPEKTTVDTDFTTLADLLTPGTYTPSELKAVFHNNWNGILVYLNAIKTVLESTTDADSGADNIGATAITDLTGNTVQALLESLKALVDSQLPTPDGSITNTKLATDVKVGSLAALTTTDKSSVVAAVNEHLDETMSHFASATRDLSIEGSQEITGFPFKAKFLIIEVTVGTEKKYSFGRVSQNLPSSTSLRLSDGIYIATSVALRIYDSSADFTSASVIINEGSITLTWSKNGVGASGTALIRIHALSHGGV